MPIRHFKYKAGYSKCTIASLRSSLMVDRKVGRWLDSFLCLEALEYSLFLFLNLHISP